MSDIRRVDFGSPFKDRFSDSLELWLPQMRANLADILMFPATLIPKENRKVGFAVAAGPSAEKNVHLLKGREDGVICCADRAGAAYGDFFQTFYVGTSDPSPVVAKFYEKMVIPKAAIMSIFTHQQTVLAAKRRKIPRYYYTPALKDDKDRELKLINKLLLTLTEAPLMMGVSDSGSLAWRILVGLGCTTIGLVGFDMSEPYDRPFRLWSLYPAYLQYMRRNGIEDVEKMKGMMNVRRYTHPTFGNDYWTDVSWDSYRGKFLTLLEHGLKQGIKTINCSEAGSLYTEWLPCMKLEKFLAEQLPSY